MIFPVIRQKDSGHHEQACRKTVAAFHTHCTKNQTKAQSRSDPFHTRTQDSYNAVQQVVDAFDSNQSVNHQVLVKALADSDSQDIC